MRDGEAAVKCKIVRFVDGTMMGEETENIVGWCAAAGVAIIGAYDRPDTRAYMQGAPLLLGFAGPRGSTNENFIRYEDEKSHEILSR